MRRVAHDDVVYLISPPKPPFGHLWMKPLHVCIRWGNGEEFLPAEDFVNIKASQVTRFKFVAWLKGRNTKEEK